MERLEGEHWDNKQRNSHSIQQTPYFAAFQPTLAQFFIQEYTTKNQLVFDPFSGRGTTAIEASLLGRHGIWRERNLYGRCLILGKNAAAKVAYQRLAKAIEVGVTMRVEKWEIDRWIAQGLHEFFHLSVIKQLISLRKHVETLDPYTRDFIKMLVCITMTGHSPGYLSVRTMPPNQQIKSERQAVLNKRAEDRPRPKNVADLLIRRAQRLIQDGLPPKPVYELSNKTPKIDLLLTSPPFLDVVDYNEINWIRIFWLQEGREKQESLIYEKSVEAWKQAMFKEMQLWKNYLSPEATVCIEAGKVRKQKIDLIDEILKLAPKAGYTPVRLYIQNTEHTRTARCWGVQKDQGTTTQQVAVFKLG